MALPKTETFTGSNGTDLNDYNASWVETKNVLEIQGNACGAASSGAESCNSWQGDVFADAHYALATVTVAPTDCIGVACRCQAAGTGDYYGVYTCSDYYYSFENDGTTWTEKAHDTKASVGHKIKIEADGTAINIYKDTGGGWVKDTTLSFTDGTHSGGYAGVTGYNDTDGRIDDWEGGNVDAGGDLHQFAPKPTAASTTAAVSMPVLRPIGPKPTGASATPAVISRVLRPLSLSSAGASDTGDISMPVLRPLSFGAIGASDTSAIELLTAAIIAFSVAISAVSETPDTVSMPVLRPLGFASTAESATAMVSAPVLRPLSVASTGASDTAQINLDVFIPGLVQFAATVIVQSETSTPSMPVLRALQFAGVAASDTASAVAAVARALSASITAATATGTPELNRLISLLVSMAADSATTACAISMLRALTVAASAGSLTSDAIARVLRPLAASYSAATITSAAALVTAGLGVIVNPEILSVTVRRILAAAGAGYEIESITTRRTIH